MQESRLKHESRTIKNLVEDYRAGRIVIPEFQREYVWRKSKAPLLIDSIYQNFPISSLLLWRSDAEVHARRATPRANRSGSTSWLIDGQQRVITLSKTIDGEDGIDGGFNPDTEEFKLSNAATRKNPDWIRVADIWSDEAFRRLRRQFDGSRQAERFEARLERVRRIRDYEVPIVEMVDHDFDDAVKAFERINTLGVRLKKEDIESARVAARHQRLIADEIVPYLHQIRQQGFQRLNVMHLFRACAFIARPDGRNRTPLHELDRKEVVGAWKQTKQATGQAIALIRSELGLINMDILWSGALMVPLIAICATVKARDRKADELVGWLALAALCRRYSGASETALEQDLRACKQSDPVRALLANLRTHRSTLLAEPKDFSGSLNDRSGLLTLYIASTNRGGLDFFTRSKVLLQGNIDRHHILPRAQFSEVERTSADNIANIAFITSEVNKSIGQSGPEVYLGKIELKTLKSQCVPLDRDLWRIDRAVDFWRARRELLAESFNDFVQKKLPQRRLWSATNR
ncbi:MAG TPA: DUF262 domain-containing protein [Ottowia sp.]|nr:DUF262 domain-containing protein [Ottowia sp.]